MDSIVYKVAFLLILPCILAGQSMANSEADALFAVKKALHDPNNVLKSWEDDIEDPCTFLHVICDDAEQHVVRLELYDQNLGGKLSPQISQLSYLQYLNFPTNSLEGSIPDSLGDLKNLIGIDLFENKFSGHIPASLSHLPKLRYLRLNNNRLSGNIPASLTSISSLQVLNLAHNNLSGPVPTGGSFAQFTGVSFAGNPNLCGQVVGKPCH
eukprot:PITA_21160